MSKGSFGFVEFYANAGCFGKGDESAVAFVREFVDVVVLGFVVFGIFLGNKVGNAGVKVNRCGGSEWAEVVVGDNGAVIGWCRSGWGLRRKAA